MLSISTKKTYTKSNKELMIKFNYKLTYCPY